VAGTSGAHDFSILRDLSEAQRRQTRIRVLLRSTAPGDATVKVVEGFAVEISSGADGKPRVRMAVPVGHGDPIEVRLELASIAMVQLVA
jgi:hypothetical protein